VSNLPRVDTMKQGRAQDFSLGQISKGRRPSARMLFLGEGSIPPLRSALRCELPSGVRGEAPIVKKLDTIFSTQDGLPDTIILLIVDYHAAIGRGQDPVPPAYAPDMKLKGN